MRLTRIHSAQLVAATLALAVLASGLVLATTAMAGRDPGIKLRRGAPRIEFVVENATPAVNEQTLVTGTLLDFDPGKGNLVCLTPYWEIDAEINPEKYDPKPDEAKCGVNEPTFKKFVTFQHAGEYGVRLTVLSGRVVPRYVIAHRWTFLTVGGSR